MARTTVLFSIISLLFSSAASAEALPGLIDGKTMETARAKANQQKRDAQAVIRKQAGILGYGKAQIDQALMPTMERRGTFNVTLKDGTVVEFPWFRTGFAENRLANTGKALVRDKAGTILRHETNKGGVRLHHGVFADEVYALALKMDTKLAIARDAMAGHSFRGAKGGIGAGRVVKVGKSYEAKVGDYVDPAAPVFNRAQIMRKFAASYRKAGGAVGPGLDIQAGDVNTKAAEMKVLARAYGTKTTPSPGVSGKAVMRTKDGAIDPRGGIEYRGISTGEGVWMSARLAARKVGLKVRGATVMAQGWGEVGRAFGMAAVKNGARVVGIQEVWKVNGKKVVGTLLNPGGAAAKPRQVKQWLADVDAMRAKGEDLASFKGGTLLQHFKAGMDASKVKADIVGVNALGNVLNSKTVPAYVKSGTHQGRRKILAEGANLAETSDGARLLDRHQGKLLTVAGDLANLGGVHVSNLEAAQNTYGEQVSSGTAKRSLLGTVRAGWNRAMKIARTKKVSERQAIELAAVDGMMKRSLQLSTASRSSLERRVISKQARVRARSNAFLVSLGAGKLAPTRIAVVKQVRRAPVRRVTAKRPNTRLIRKMGSAPRRRRAQR